MRCWRSVRSPTATNSVASAGVDVDGGYVPVDNQMRSNVSHIYAAGDLSGRLPLSSVATMQGRKIAEHAMKYSHTAIERSTTTKRRVRSSPSLRSPMWAG